MNEEMKKAWAEISKMLVEPTPIELDVFLRTWQRATEAHKQALAEQPAQQEPVAWEQFYPDTGKPKLAYLSPTESPENACYIPPAQRTWAGLTDEEIDDIYQGVGKNELMLVREVEARLKEKNK